MARANRHFCASWRGSILNLAGEAWVADGATVGYLQQEPQLDPQLNVLGNVMEGVAAKEGHSR